MTATCVVHVAPTPQESVREVAVCRRMRHGDTGAAPLGPESAAVVISGLSAEPARGGESLFAVPDAAARVVRGPPTM